MLGRNDADPIGPTIATDVAALRTALGPATELFVIVPLDGRVGSSMTTGMTSYCGTFGSVTTISGTRVYLTCANDPKTFYIGFGADGATGLDNGVTFESSDGTHPNTERHSIIATYVTQAIMAIESAGSSVSGLHPSPIVVQ